MRAHFPNYDTLEKWAKNNPAIVAITVIIVVCSSIATLVPAGYTIYEKLHRSFFPHSIEYRKIEKLSTGATIAHFSSVLGAPQFRNLHDGGREYIYVHDNYYVQAITDSFDSVLAYSITTRKADFNPVFDLHDMTGNPMEFRVVLGKTTFADLPERPRIICSGFGHRRSWYNESYYFGNAGFHLTYILAYADSGVRKPDDVRQVNGVELRIRTQNDLDALDPALKTFRASCPINTFFVGDIESDIAKDAERKYTFGADLDTVRVLNMKQGGNQRQPIK